MALTVRTAQYVYVSDLPEGPTVQRWLFLYSNITFGDASLVLVNLQRLKDALEVWDDTPLVFLEALAGLSPETYIDLEV